MNLLDLARSAIAEPPAKRTATAAEKAELRTLLDIILAHCPEEIEWSLGIACADVDDGLTCFRILAAEKVQYDKTTKLPEANRKDADDGSV